MRMAKLTFEIEKHLLDKCLLMGIDVQEHLRRRIMELAAARVPSQIFCSYGSIGEKEWFKLYSKSEKLDLSRKKLLEAVKQFKKDTMGQPEVIASFYRINRKYDGGELSRRHGKRGLCNVCKMFFVKREYYKIPYRYHLCFGCSMSRQNPLFRGHPENYIISANLIKWIKRKKQTELLEE